MIWLGRAGHFLNRISAMLPGEPSWRTPRRRRARASDCITFDPSGEARVHSFYAVNTLSLAKQFTLSAFIGPQYSENQGLTYGALQPTNANSWTLAGGAEV